MQDTASTVSRNGTFARFLLRQTKLNDIGLRIECDIWGYEEWYVDEQDGLEKPMIPANKVFLGNPRAETQFLYGAIRDVHALAAVPRFPKQWIVEDPSQNMLMVQSAPLPLVKRVDAFMTATVL